MHSSTAYGMIMALWLYRHLLELCLEDLSVLTLNCLKTRKTYFWTVLFPSLFVFQLYSLLPYFPEINRQSRIIWKQKSQLITIFLGIISDFWGRNLFCFGVWFWGFYLAKDLEVLGKNVWAIVVIFQRIKKIHSLQGTHLSFLWKCEDDIILFYYSK